MDAKEIQEFAETSETAKIIWNAAIETAIDKLELIGHSTDNDIEAIRSLKK